MSLAITWVHLFLAGIAGLGLGIGIVIGAAIVRWTRPGGGRVSGPPDPPPIDDGKHRA